MESLCGEGRSKEGRQGGHPGFPLGMGWRPPPAPALHNGGGSGGADPFLSQALSIALQASPSTVPAAGARPRQDGIFPTLPHQASGTRKDAPHPAPTPTKNPEAPQQTSSPQPCPTHTAPHGPPIPAGSTLPLTSKIKI